MKESVFQKELIDKLYSQGAWLFNIHGHAMQKAGVADLLVVHRRWTGFLELKTEDNTASKKQIDVDKDLQKRYFPSFVVRCARGMGPGRHVDVWDNVALTIENFQGEVLCRPAGLNMVLDNLQALTSNASGVPWVKMPKLFADDIRTCKAGDAIYFGKKKFVCQEDDGLQYKV